MIYFDNAATTKPKKEVLDEFVKINTENYFNPSSPYDISFNALQKNKEAKNTILNLLGDKEGNLIFTSGATESNNLAIFGNNSNKNKKYLFSSGEHPSVYNCACELKYRGYLVDFINLLPNGQIDYAQLESMIDDNTAFVSVMLVNNETGAINNIEKIREIIDNKNPKCLLHVDASQAFGKIKFNVKALKIDLCSISAHKIGGIKGVGALYVRQRVNIKNITFGGGQENNLRSGTINLAGNVSFAKAAQLAYKNLKENYEKVLELKNNIINKLSKNIKIVSDSDCLPYILSLIIPNFRGETVMRYLSSKNILVGTGSACSTNKIGNRILENMGYSKQEVMGAIRVSFSSENTLEEVNVFIKNLDECLNSLSV